MIRPPSHLRRSPKPVPPEGLTPIYYDPADDFDGGEGGDEAKEPELAGFWKLHEPEEGGALVAGILVYNSSRRLVACVPNVGEAELWLRRRRHNAALRRTFLEKFND